MLACENCYNDPCTCGYQGYLKWMLHLRITKTDKKPEKEKIMGDVEIKMLGSVYKLIVKPPKLDESG